MHFFTKRRLYLDWAAAAPVSARALRVFEEAVRSYGNPSSVHAEGRQAHAVLEHARKRIALLLGAKAENVYFVSGATEGNTLAVLGGVKAALLHGAQDPHVLVEDGAHASLDALVAALEQLGAVVERLSVTNGTLSTEELLQKLRPTTVLVAVQAVCSETGSRHDTRGIKAALQKARSQTVLHVDASQLPLVESADMTRLGADSLVLDAQKVGGVRGVGVLALQKGVSIESVLFGGSQERGVRPGTPAPALATAFASALEEARTRSEQFSEDALLLRQQFVRQITEAVPEAVIQGGKRTVPHIISFSFPGLDTDYLQALLDKEGVAVATRSACETNSAGSRAVLAQTGNAAESSATLRISFGPGTAKRDMHQAAEKLVSAVRFLKQSAIK